MQNLDLVAAVVFVIATTMAIFIVPEQVSKMKEERKHG